MRGLPTALALLVLAGCGGGQPAAEPTGTAPMSVAVHSRAFADGAPIPARYTCDGAGGIPRVQWSSVPGGARALALVVDDPDAPGGTFTHWLVLDLPPDTRAVGPGTLPSGAVEGANSAGDEGWTPPCPPQGDPAHHYRFTVYALDAETGLSAGASPDDAADAIDRHEIARGRLTGTYARR